MCNIVFSCRWRVLLLLGLATTAGCRRTEGIAQKLAVSAVQLGKTTAQGAPIRLGKLTLLGALELRADHPHFGGLSGLSVRDNKILYAISDRGRWFSARLSLDALGALVSLDTWRTGRLKGPGGAAVTGRLGDAEGLAQDRDGSWLVSFEWKHRLWRYATLAGEPTDVSGLQAKLEGAPGNGGVEALTVLADGRLLALCEHFANPDGSLKGWLGRPGRFRSMSYVPTEGFAPTDLATLASGDVLVLERRYTPRTGAAIRIRRIAADSLEPEARVVSREIARLAPPLPVDNFEGLAVHSDPQHGSTTVYMVSDDNFSRRQRTLLYQFRLER
jgi:hypothetical protein